MDLAASIAGYMGFSPERIEDIRTAVSEATLNAIEHGNRLDPATEVRVVLLPEPDMLEISVQDQSIVPLPAAPQLHPAPTVESKLAAGSRTRGWGVFLMNSLVDEVDFRSTGHGNVVRMTIHLRRQVPPLERTHSWEESNADTA